jgi:hypothetical protein
MCLVVAELHRYEHFNASMNSICSAVKSYWNNSSTGNDTHMNIQKADLSIMYDQLSMKGLYTALQILNN